MTNSEYNEIMDACREKIKNVKLYQSSNKREYFREGVRAVMSMLHNMQKHKKLTNYERIRDMTIDEMTEFLCGIRHDEENASIRLGGEIIPAYSDFDIKDWLEREVNE